MPVQELIDHALALRVKQRALELGFDLVGIAPATPSSYGDHFRKWIDEGQAGEMGYLGRRVDERTDVGAYLHGAASVISVAMNYHQPLETRPSDEKACAGRIARYALGDDYHEIIKSKLYELADWLRTASPGSATKCGVDTAPIMEKELAARAGIGWIGKNTCLINPRVGSWLLLGEIITTLPLPVDPPATDHCGSCRRCIDACPTYALTAPYQLDARRCISYLTIEHRGEITPELQNQIGDWLYGCDICQQVCPHNGDAPDDIDPSFKARFATGSLDAAEVIGWDSSTYRERLRHSAIKRIKLPILQRNASIVIRNHQRTLAGLDE